MKQIRLNKKESVPLKDVAWMRLFKNATEIWMNDGRAFVIRKPLDKILFEECKYEQCIPYEENKHLLNTTNDCDNYYKTWK